MVSTVSDKRIKVFLQFDGIAEEKIKQLTVTAE